MGMSADKIKEEFITDMGGGLNGVVTVELSNAQFENAVKSSKRWFIAKKGVSVWRPITVVENQLQYSMATDVAQVLDVVFQVPTDVAAFFTLGFFDIIPYGPNTLMSTNSGLSNYSGFVQLLQFTESRKRVFSVEPDWFYDQQSRILNVTQRSGNPTGIMLVQCKLTDFNPTILMDKDEHIFARYVKAKCKEIVGRVRSKYDSMPGAAGPVTMDGVALLAEAKEEMTALELEIQAAQGPDMPITG